MALPTQMKLLKTQAFTIALIAACGVAWIVPDAGAPGGILKSEFTTKIAVVIAFFLQGLNIRAKQLLGSISKGRVLLFCQIWNFAIAPTIMLAIVFVADRWIHPGVRDGLLYLSILPTTISSSIVLTGSYSGDTATSLLNATLSNLLGVFVTPLWCIILFSHATSQFPPMAALISRSRADPSSLPKSPNREAATIHQTYKQRDDRIHRLRFLFKQRRKRTMANASRNCPRRRLRSLLPLPSHYLNSCVANLSTRRSANRPKDCRFFLRLPKDLGGRRADGSDHLRQSKFRRTRPFDTSSHSLSFAAAFSRRNRRTATRKTQPGLGKARPHILDPLGYRLRRLPFQKSLK